MLKCEFISSPTVNDPLLLYYATCISSLHNYLDLFGQPTWQLET